VFFFITSTIFSLSSAPQENRYWNSNLIGYVCVAEKKSIINDKSQCSEEEGEQEIKEC
jgi:hypothetical protein